VTGEAFFLNSPSEYLRLSLSAREVNKPHCIVELSDDCRPLLQLEQEQPATATAAAAAADEAEIQTVPSNAEEVQVVITSSDEQPALTSDA
jgi:hypothetical protein